MIQVSELHFSTEDGVKVLEDIHLHVEQGELMLILGSAASGKSLLLGLLGAQISPQRGQILVH
ncbi:MAG: ATP-binding cassette domain-containing protein, partial [Candidatus Bipolaricaulota bacterium]